MKLNPFIVKASFILTLLFFHFDCLFKEVQYICFLFQTALKHKFHKMIFFKKKSDLNNKFKLHKLTLKC